MTTELQEKELVLHLAHKRRIVSKLGVVIGS